MKFLALSALLSLLYVVVHAHDDHDHDMQMPLDYVKFPYQAQYYPGDNDGVSPFILHILLNSLTIDP